MRRLTVVAITGLIFISVLAAGFGTAAGTATQSSDTVYGISYGPVAESDIENIDEIEATLESFGINPPSETTSVVDSDGNNHIVFSSEPIPAGEATVEGRTFSTSEVSGNIVVADDFEVETQGEPVSFDELKNNPQQYEYEVVRFNAATTVGSVAAKPSSTASSQQAVANFNNPGDLPSSVFDGQPGELASWGVTNLSDNDISQGGEFQERFPDSGMEGFSFGHQFWGEGDAVVDAAVVPQYGGMAGEDMEVIEYDLLILDVNYEGERVNSPGDIRSGDYVGEIVTVESDIVGSSISAQEYLTSVASCGEKSVSVPMSPPVCVPVTHDLVVHSGVLIDGTSPGEIPITYAGVSNKIQSVPTEAETGRYEITGEVVSTAEIDSSLENGYALRVYDLERIGDLNTAGGFEDEADQVEQRIKAQIELEESEWGSASSNEESSGSNDGSSSDQTGQYTVTKQYDFRGGSIEDTEIEVGDKSTVKVTIESHHSRETEFPVLLYRDGEPTTSLEIVELQPGESKSVELPYRAFRAGEFEVSVNGTVSEGHHTIGTITVEDQDRSYGQGDSSGDPDRGSDEEKEGGVLSAISSPLDSQPADMVGVFLAIVSAGMFLLGIGLEVARLLKRRFSDEKPNLTERMTSLIVGCASAGFLVSGLLIDSDWRLLLVLFGGIGVLTFAGDYLVREISIPALQRILDLEDRQSRTVLIVGSVILVLGGLALSSILFGFILPDSPLPVVIQFTMGVFSFFAVIFGSVTGVARLYKKHLADETPNTGKNIGLVITFTGAAGLLTAGVLAPMSVGEILILPGMIVLLLCCLYMAGKGIYKIA